MIEAIVLIHIVIDKNFLMDSKKLKVAYLILAGVVLLLTSIYVLFIEDIQKSVSYVVPLTGLILLMIVFFVMIFIYEQKHPPKPWQNKVGILLIILMSIYCIFSLVQIL